MAQMCGGPSAEKDATEEVQALCDKVRPHVEEKLGANALSEYTAKKYTSQVVAGTNYFVKIHVGDGKHVHARIYRDLQQNVSLHSVQDGKAHEDPITYF